MRTNLTIALINRLCFGEEKAQDCDMILVPSFGSLKVTLAGPFFTRRSSPTALRPHVEIDSSHESTVVMHYGVAGSSLRRSLLGKTTSVLVGLTVDGRSLGTQH